MKRSWQLSALAATFAIISPPTSAQQNEEEELAAAYGDKNVVSIAAGYQQPVSKAPSSATVITTRDIAAMGAKYLSDALKMVPGVHSYPSSKFNAPQAALRGITSAFNPEVLILFNGIPLNTNYDGSPGLSQGEIPLENIARIEVLRGPGSALYGADAFSGVINLITKTADEIKGFEAGAGIGEFNTRHGWLQYGHVAGSLKASFYLRHGRTDGNNKIIPADQATFLDSIFQTRTSLAPGPLNNDAREVDFRADISIPNWRFRFGHQRRKLGTAAGANDALDSEAILPGTRIEFVAENRITNLFRSFDLSTTYSYYNAKQEFGRPGYRLLPRGALAGAFPDGIIGNPLHYQRYHRLHLNGAYDGFANHKIRFGFGYEIQDLYKTREFKNFTLTSQGIIPLGRLVDATGNVDLIYLSPQKRNLKYFNIQDEWNFAKDWNVTYGVRHDKYSDFGTTTNPRVALVYDLAYNMTVKGLYGNAFRAPNFTEQYNSNNPVAAGNANVKPEKIKTTELAFLWSPRPTLQTSLTFYRFSQSNIIQYQVGTNGIATAQNLGNQTGRGFELEATWDYNRDLHLIAHYSHQKTTDESSGADAGIAPQNRLFFRGDWRFAASWLLSASVNHVADRKRQATDTRPQIADYTTVDLNLRREKLWGNWEVQLSVKNLFDRDVFSPTLAPATNLPGDYPEPGRAFYLQILKKF